MTGEVSFTLAGDPIPKGRPRTGQGRTYTPARTRTAEKAIKTFVEGLGVAPFNEPVRMSLVFYCATRRRTDIDNLEKLVSDALNGLIYTDDHLIHAKTSRLYRAQIGEEPRTEVRVVPLGDVA